MNQKKRNVSNRDKENEPSTSNSNNSERSQRTKKFIPDNYLYRFDDDGILFGAGSEICYSGSEWEASQSDIAGYIADGGSMIIETINTLENSTIPNAMNPEYSNGDIIVETDTSLNERSVLINNNSTNISNNEETILEVVATPKKVWTLNEIIAKDRAGLIFTIARQATVRQKVTARAWQSFDVVGVNLDGKEIITNFAKCKKCEEFVQFHGSTTTQLNRHKCNDDVQPKIDQCLKKEPKITVSNDDKLIFRDAAAQLVAVDVRPFSAVEGEGMRTFLLTAIKIAKKYKSMSDEDFVSLLPRRITVARHITDKAREAKEVMIKDFQRALEFPGGFTCTTDLYTDSNKSINYLGITASLNLLENGKIKQKQYIVNLNKLNAVEKTGENIWAELKKCLESYNLTEQQLIEKILWITDRGGNLMNALSKCRRLNCYAHIINNLVKYMCEKDAEVKKIIAQCSVLVRYMKTASVDTSKLKSSLKSLIETRWNTVFFMIQSIIFNFIEIHEILIEKERSSSVHRNVSDKIRCLSRETLEEVCSFLELFKDISIQLEGEQYATIHRVWPAYVRIMSHLQENGSDIPIVKKMKQLGRKYMAESNVQPEIEHKVSVFLHPLLKKLSYTDDLQRETIITQVRVLLSRSNHESQTINEIQMNETLSESDNSSSRTDRLHLFQDFLAADSSNSPNSDDEVQKYIDFQVKPVDNLDAFKLFEWWEQHQAIFPNLFQLFMRVFTASATSAASERGFSVAGRTLDPLRSSLKPSTVNSLMLAKDFYRHNRTNDK